MAAMSYDNPDVLAEFSEAKNIGYVLLSDESGGYFVTLGIRNEEYGKEHFAHGVPHPGILFIDTQGVLRLKRAVPGYRDRPPLEELHEALAAELESIDDLGQRSLSTEPAPPSPANPSP